MKLQCKMQLKKLYKQHTQHNYLKYYKYLFGTGGYLEYHLIRKTSAVVLSIVKLHMKDHSVFLRERSLSCVGAVGC